MQVMACAAALSIDTNSYGLVMLSCQKADHEFTTFVRLMRRPFYIEINFKLLARSNPLPAHPDYSKSSGAASP